MRASSTFRSRCLLFVVACATSGVSTPAALGQVFSGVPTSRPLVLPPDAGARTQTAEAPSQVEPAPSRPPIQEPLLRRLPAGNAGWQIEGSAGQLDWQVHLPGGVAGRAIKFRLRFDQDVSVLPSSSPVSVFVNGRRVGTSLEPASSGLTLDLPVPEGIALAGLNRVTIAAEHRHRVDCSLDATYELRTRVDSAATGFLLAPEVAQPTRLLDLSATPRASNGSLRLNVIATGQTTPSILARHIRAAEAAALAARASNPVVEFSPIATVGALNIAIHRGTVSPSGDVTPLAPGVKLERTEDGIRILHVSGADDVGLDAAIDALAAAAVDRGASLDVAGVKPLFDFGPLPRKMDGIRQTIRFALKLPDDFLPGGYDKAMVQIAGETRSETGEVVGQLRLDANGREAMVVPLPRRAGLFRQPLQLPLEFLRPGMNQLVLSVILAGNAGPCEATRAPPVTLTMSPDSSITLPNLARVGRLPDLARLASGTAFGGGGRTLRLVLPEPSPASVSAAATVAARLAVARQGLLDLDLSLDGQPGPHEDALVIAPIGAIGPGLLGITGLDASAVAHHWSPSARPVGSREASSGGSIGASGSDRSCDGRSVAAVLKTRQNDDEAAAGWQVKLTTLLDLGKRFFGPRPTRHGAPTRAETALLSQGVAANGGRVTLLSAPDGAALQRAAACLGRSDVWGQLSGATQFLDPARGRLRTLEEPWPHYYATQSLSATNARLVAGAWLSSHAIVVVSASLLLVGFGAISTTLLLGTIGRRST